MSASLGDKLKTMTNPEIIMTEKVLLNISSNTLVAIYKTKCNKRFPNNRFTVIWKDTC